MVHTVMLGSGKWVLAPGTLCTAAVFDPLRDALNLSKGDCQIIMPDAPDVRDYDARLRRAVTGGEIVCGFSLGALILAHNLQALKAARAIVLLASNPFPDPPGSRGNRELIRDRVLAGGARDWICENWAVMSASRNESLREFVISMAQDTQALITAQTELAASRPGAQDDLANTDLPLIFVTGSADILTPAQRIAPIAQSAKTAHLSVIDGLGHFALIEAPGRVAEAIKTGFDALGLNPNGKAYTNETREHSGVAS